MSRWLDDARGIEETATILDPASQRRSLFSGFPSKSRRCSFRYFAQSLSSFLTSGSLATLNRPSARIIARTDIVGCAAWCRALHFEHHIIGVLIRRVVLISCNVALRRSRNKISSSHDIVGFHCSFRMLIISGNHLLLASPDAMQGSKSFGQGLSV